MPTIPTVNALLVFSLLLVLLVQGEVLRAIGKPPVGRWRLASTSLTALLILVYGLILVSRFVNLLN